MSKKGLPFSLRLGFDYPLISIPLSHPLTIAQSDNRLKLAANAMTKITKNNLPIIVLTFIAVLICFTNYTPGTFLSGWDTLHPEFNFGLAIKRELFGAFRTYQGLGAVAGHSDMADLPRIILLFLLSPFMPMSYLRYFYIFLTLILGPIGMYYFLKYILVIPSEAASDAAKSRNPMKGTNNEGISHFVRDDNTLPSFLGALFYLLNLGTMQQFVVPFEMFTTQYASLPWLFLFATEYLIEPRQSVTVRAIPSNVEGESRTIFDKTSRLSRLNRDRSKNKKVRSFSLLFFAITTVLAAPQAYAATLWYMYFIALMLFILSLTFAGALKKNFSLIKKALTLILLTLSLNSFWILPNVYFVLNHGAEVTKSNISKLFSPQAFLYNREFGDIVDISLLKSFLFDWNVYSNDNRFTQLLAPWITHLKQPFVQPLGFLFAEISFCGITYGALKRNKILLSLLPLLLLCLFFLFNDNFPNSYLYTFLADKIPFFKEAFRFPQDKVFGIFTFIFAIYFAAGQFLITRILRSITYSSSESRFNRESREVNNLTMKQFNNEATNNSSRLARTISKIQLAQATIFILLLLYFMLPAFQGNFISPFMRIKIPKAYFEMFKWFNKEEEGGRVANLPINSLWGWEYHNWYNNKFPSFQGAGFIWFGIKQPVLARDFDRWSPYNEQYYKEMSYAIYSQKSEALKLVLEKYNIKYIVLDKSVIAPENDSKVLLYEETQALLEREHYIQKIKDFDNTLFVYKVKSKIPNSHYVLQNPYEGFYPFRNLTDNQDRVLPNALKLTQEGVVVNLRKDNDTELISPPYLDTEESIPADLVVEKNDNKFNITFYPRFPIYDVKDQPIPIIVNTSLPKAESIILSINTKDNFILETLPSNTPLSLGTIFLKTKEDNTITLYPSIPNEEILPDLSTIDYYVEPCEDIRNQKIFGIDKANANSFSIFGKNISLCMTIPLSQVILKYLKTSEGTVLHPPSEALLNITFDYKSNLPLKFCLSKLINGSCQNYSDNRLNQYFGLQKEDIQKLGLQFQLDTTNSNNIEKAFYSNLSLGLTYPFSTDKLSLRHSGNQALPEHPESLPHPNPLPEGEGRVRGQTLSTLILPFSGNQQLSADITKLPRTSGYCPNHPIFNSPLIKKQILTNNKDRFMRYESIDGLSCDHFSYQNLSQNEAYLVAITSRNVKGLPSTLCITNAVSRHCDIYTTLSSHKDFNTDIFLLPPLIKNENGFDINIGNLGIKKSPSINDLKSIEIIPFPYKWLSKIRTATMEQSSNETMNHLLVLPQSFENGWKAYGIRNYELGIMNWVKILLPFVFGTELKNHVLVNNWENGWILDNSDFRLQTSDFLIVFLPQYLEYLGFLLLLGTSVLIIFVHR